MEHRELLQAVYAKQHDENDEPEYETIDELTAEDVRFNTARMRSTAIRLLLHADALEEYFAEAQKLQKVIP